MFHGYTVRQTITNQDDVHLSSPDQVVLHLQQGWTAGGTRKHGIFACFCWMLSWGLWRDSLARKKSEHDGFELNLTCFSWWNMIEHDIRVGFEFFFRDVWWKYHEIQHTIPRSWGEIWATVNLRSIWAIVERAGSNTDLPWFTIDKLYTCMTFGWAEWGTLFSKPFGSCHRSPPSLDVVHLDALFLPRGHPRASAGRV